MASEQPKGWLIERTMRLIKDCADKHPRSANNLRLIIPANSACAGSLADWRKMDEDAWQAQEWEGVDKRATSLTATNDELTEGLKATFARVGIVDVVREGTELKVVPA